MISSKLKFILFLTLGLIYAHGVEEVITGFSFDDSWMVYFGNLVETKAEVFYWTFHVMWWILVPVAIILLTGSRKWIYSLLVLFGIVYFTELHHIIKAIFAGHYYPGMITASLYPIVGVFYWKELLKEWRLK